MKTMRPFGRFVRPRAERCQRPRFEGLSPASECCAFGQGQRTISARAYVTLHYGPVLQAHARERSATTLRRCLRVLARARAIRSRGPSAAEDRFRARWRPARGAQGARVAARALGRPVAVDSKIKSRHTANAALKQSGLAAVRRIAAPIQECR